MSRRKRPFTKEEFDAIYSRVPRLTVEAILRSKDGGVWLAKRSVPPAVGLWYITGGTVLMREKLIDAVKRVATEELSITEFPEDPKMLGVIEYDFGDYNGFPISIAYEIISDQIPQKGLDGEELELFSELPKNIIPEQRDFLVEHFGFKRSKR